MSEFFKYEVTGKDRYLNLDQIIYADDVGPVIRVTTALPVGAGIITIGGEAADALRKALKDREKTGTGPTPSSRLSS